MARRILWAVVILLGGAIASERSADILIALSPYRSSGSVPRGMSATTPMLATQAVAVEPARADIPPEANPDPELLEEPAAYMAPPLRVQVTTFDGPEEGR